MALRRIGLVLLLVGALTPLVLLSLADGYRLNAGILANIQSMFVPITSDKKEPDFREVDFLGSHLQLVRYGNTGMTLGFPDSMDDDEMAAAIKAERRFENKPLPKYMQFYGWRVASKGVRIPFRYVASTGVLIVLAGLVVLALSPALATK